MIIRTIVHRSQLIGHLLTLMALDSLQLVLHVLVDWVVGVVMGGPGLGVVVLVDGPRARGLAIELRVVAIFLVSSVAVGCVAEIAALADRTGSCEGTSEAGWATRTKRGATLPAEGVVEIMLRRTRRRTWRLWETAVGAGRQSVYISYTSHQCTHPVSWMILAMRPVQPH